MNKFFILILFLSSTLFAVIDERKSDIYYGNGIMTTEVEAQYSLDRVIKPAVLEKIYFNDQTEMDKHHHFDLAYNYSAKEDFGDTAIATILDLLESYEQMANTSFGWWAVSAYIDLVKGSMTKVSSWSKERVSFSRSQRPRWECILKFNK